MLQKSKINFETFEYIYLVILFILYQKYFTKKMFLIFNNENYYAKNVITFYFFIFINIFSR